MTLGRSTITRKGDSHVPVSGDNPAVLWGLSGGVPMVAWHPRVAAVLVLVALLVLAAAAGAADFEPSNFSW